ncbi:MAG TPA: hypothetical protein VFM93_06825 [Candidatus Limnocylindria bacterium]|nr:hypothetical protein [Candidatus Limnocylindria bacterium]
MTRDVGTIRSLLRQRWPAEPPTWGAILVAPTVPHGRSANGYVTGRLARIVREHRGEDAIQYEIWIPAPPP